MNWFNNRRLLEPIGNIPPAEAEERYYAMLEQPAWRRNSNQMASDKPRGSSADLSLTCPKEDNLCAVEAEHEQDCERRGAGNRTLP